MGADPALAVAAVAEVDEVAGRYAASLSAATKHGSCWPRTRRLAGSAVDGGRTCAGVVISVNGQVPDGEDLSGCGMCASNISPRRSKRPRCGRR
ncbi:UDP-N-acetylmuramyl tripeptide synthase domain protein [Mycobacterium ulcerans str. Harvey]|nr:UDP-N-acetylmuramyl tripeptide synthase domain protein [Mycobacterium ulcerans str. Harvey]